MASPLPSKHPHKWGIPPSEWERGPSPAIPHRPSSRADASPPGPDGSQKSEAKSTCYFRAVPKMFRGLESVNLIAVFPGVCGNSLASAFASGLVCSTTIKLLFLRKIKFPVGHGSHHAILQWKKVTGCVPLAPHRENQHGLNGCSTSVQD